MNEKKNILKKIEENKVVSIDGKETKNKWNERKRSQKRKWLSSSFFGWMWEKEEM